MDITASFQSCQNYLAFWVGRSGSFAGMLHLLSQIGWLEKAVIPADQVKLFLTRLEREPVSLGLYLSLLTGMKE